MEEEILHYLPTAMFRGAPCIVSRSKNSECSHFDGTLEINFLELSKLLEA